MSIKHSGKESGFITVFGSANIDIGGMPHLELIEKDSNPGLVCISPGGVGRNIAHNLCLLGNRVKLVSAFGNDEFAGMIRKNLWITGVDVKDSFISDKDHTSVYLYITDEEGNTKLAVNDMGIYRHITPEFISEKEDLLQNSSLIVVDANLPQNTIEYICAESCCPVIAESVSCAKVVKMKKALPNIHTIAGNYMEAGLLSGHTIDPDDFDSIRAAADALLSEGAERVVITLSHRGVFFADNNTSKQLPALKANMVNSNGAGDALLSGLVTGYARSLSFEDSVRLGTAAAAITLETSDTNNPALSFESASERKKSQGA